jgi:CubicO group peptidase (beta-lactamase class C family)
MILSNTTLDARGVCAPAFAGVRDAFVANFTDRGEIGAAFSLVVDGETVVDLWGGWRDAARSRPWEADSLVNVWSTTKGLNAICFAMLVQRGLADYEAPVARWWPEFAAAGKDDITLGDLLSHQAGLSGFTTPAVLEDLYAGEAAAQRLAAQAPIWPPRSASGYHAISIGILAAALFRRIEGRPIGRFVAEEIAAPFGLDLSIGLSPPNGTRAAEMIAPPEMGSAALGALNPAQIAALANPGLDPRLPNTEAWRAAELPSANGFSNARALARLYALLLSPDGPLVGAETLAKATTARIEGRDLVLDLFARWAAGFLRNSEELYGPHPESFGHSGWGGSFAFADPKAGIAMSYTMNRMSAQLRGDPRAMALIEAVYAAL